MKFRGLIVAAVVLLILAGFLYWSQHHKPKENASTANTTPAIVKIDPASVTSLTVKQKGAPPVTLVRSGTQWKITAPGDYPADSGTVSGLLSSLSPLNSQSVVDDHATDVSKFGLSDPSLEVDVTGKDSKTSRLLLGDDAPADEGVYVQLGGDARVFTAASYIKTSLNKSLGDLRDKRLLPVESTSVSSIDLTRKGQTLSFARIQNGWQMEKPQSYRTDNYQVDDLLSQLTSAKWDPSISTEDAARDFGHATPVATVKLTGSGGNETLEVRKEKDNDYAKSSVLPGAWQIDASSSSALDADLERSLDDFRNKQLFDFGYADPEKIEYQSGATSIELTRTSSNNWTSNGKKMDTDSAEAVVTALRDMAASKFVTSGFSNPTVDLTVTSDSGKRIEKVQIEKTSDGAIAKREDGPSLYSLDSVTLSGLTDAIAGLKPAAPEKKKK